jgi:hypothetical protein
MGARARLPLLATVYPGAYSDTFLSADRWVRLDGTDRGPTSMVSLKLAGGTWLYGHKLGSTAPLLAFMAVGRVVNRWIRGPRWMATGWSCICSSQTWARSGRARFPTRLLFFPLMHGYM